MSCSLLIYQPSLLPISSSTLLSQCVVHTLDLPRRHFTLKMWRLAYSQHHAHSYNFYPFFSQTRPQVIQPLLNTPVSTATMHLFIDSNMSAAQYIAILKSIERSTTTYIQWAQLTKPMVQALPWHLLQQYPEGLAEAKKQLAAAAEEAENTQFDSDEDEGIQWGNETDCWTFSSLPFSHPSASTPTD